MTASLQRSYFQHLSVHVRALILEKIKMQEHMLTQTNSCAGSLVVDQLRQIKVSVLITPTVSCLGWKASRLQNQNGAKLDPPPAHCLIRYCLHRGAPADVAEQKLSSIWMDPDIYSKSNRALSFEEMKCTFMHSHVLNVLCAVGLLVALLVLILVLLRDTWCHASSVCVCVSVCTCVCVCVCVCTGSTHWHR